MWHVRRRSTYTSLWVNLKERDHLEDLTVDGKTLFLKNLKEIV